MFDRTGQKVRFMPSAPAGDGHVTIKGEANGGLLTVPVKLNGVAMKALIDTGAGITLANPAALKALGWDAKDPRLSDAGQIHGATADGADVRKGEVETLNIGPMTMHKVPMYFSTAATGDQEPSIILGVDLLDQLDAYALDFPRGELQIRMPPR
jgi:predicted aspartyl protease